jgi:hypothetical protein
MYHVTKASTDSAEKPSHPVNTVIAVSRQIQTSAALPMKTERVDRFDMSLSAPQVRSVRCDE